MKILNIFGVFTIALFMNFLKPGDAIVVANTMQFFQETKNPNIKIGFVNFVKVSNMTLNAKPTRKTKARNEDICVVECLQAQLTCFGVNFVHNMGKQSNTDNCEQFQEDIVINDLVPNENVHHHALENPCLSFPCHNGGLCLRNLTLDTYTCKCAFFYSGTNCDVYKEEKPVTNNMIKVLPILTKTWSLSVDIKPLGLIEKEYTSVVYAMENYNLNTYGDRTPAIWFLPNSLRITIESAVSGQTYNTFYSTALPINQYTSVNISQIFMGGEYIYKIFINESIVREVVNTHSREFYNVGLYVGHHRDVAANAYIKNLIYENSV